MEEVKQTDDNVTVITGLKSKKEVESCLKAVKDKGKIVTKYSLVERTKVIGVDPKTGENIKEEVLDCYITLYHGKLSPKAHREIELSNLHARMNGMIDKKESIVSELSQYMDHVAKNDFKNPGAISVKEIFKIESAIRREIELFKNRSQREISKMTGLPISIDDVDFKEGHLEVTFRVRDKIFRDSVIKIGRYKDGTLDILCQYAEPTSGESKLEADVAKFRTPENELIAPVQALYEFYENHREFYQTKNFKSIGGTLFSLTLADRSEFYLGGRASDVQPLEYAWDRDTGKGSLDGKSGSLKLKFSKTLISLMENLAIPTYKLPNYILESVQEELHLPDLLKKIEGALEEQAITIPFGKEQGSNKPTGNKSMNSTEGMDSPLQKKLVRA